MSAIKQVTARQILDCRGIPTVEADVILHSGIFGRATVPAGSTTGTREAIELRDGDPHCFAGLGVLNAVVAINSEVNELLVGKEIQSQAALDQLLVALDGTDNRSNLGANGILAVSIAAARAAALELKIPLHQYINQQFLQLTDEIELKSPNRTVSLNAPLPMVEMVGNKSSISPAFGVQSLILHPLRGHSAGSALNISKEIIKSLSRFSNVDPENQSRETATTGNQGNFLAVELLLETVKEAILRSGHRLGEEVALALRLDPSLLYDGIHYRLNSSTRFDATRFSAYLGNLANNYGISTLIDPIDEGDWEGWHEITEQLGKSIRLVGGEVFVSNTGLLHEGQQFGVANAIEVKPIQVGTLSETLELIHAAQNIGYQLILSESAGETGDTFITDLAVATGSDGIIAGSPLLHQNQAKYDRLLNIERNEATAQFPR
ncbi:hypothetical protein [Motiliproteus sp. MSK22-1]|uniref:phosphopyruvate hydratase n=1 Tax=Motiliproteus sp. MSK22-1 TaxID=1897630 RepID=UPI000975A9CC|nr:hypothetical protein [Motiliproteus sp. MSK22-1]OMH33789.1 hypothetical protein BGP75_12420 [Motiliproteus sp. MSK22-1]